MDNNLTLFNFIFKTHQAFQGSKWAWTIEEFISKWFLLNINGICMTEQHGPVVYLLTLYRVSARDLQTE